MESAFSAAQPIAARRGMSALRREQVTAARAANASALRQSSQPNAVSTAHHNVRFSAGQISSAVSNVSPTPMPWIASTAAARTLTLHWSSTRKRTAKRAR